MRYSIRKNWISTFESLSKNPILFAPFIIIAFLECLALEASYFSVRKPLSLVFGPIIRKFFGEPFLHYPGNLMLLPQLFYYLQIVIYILLSVFLTAAAVQIFVSIKTGHPIIPKAIVKNTVKRYMAFAGYGLIYVMLMAILEKADGFVLLKATRFISNHLFKISAELYLLGSLLVLFFTYVIVQIFLILIIPIIVTEKKKLFKAILGSLSVGSRNFLKISGLVAVPLLFYLPVIMMKGFLAVVMVKTFPEVSFYVTLLGIVIAIFVDCFLIMSVTQFFLDTKKAK